MQIYQLTFPNGKSYVGQTIGTVAGRLKNHRRDRSFVGNALRKHGEPEVTILHECNDRDELDEQEVFWIEKLGTLYPDGYNLEPGGRSFRATDESRARMSKAQSERFADPNQRAAHADAIRAGITAETRARMSRAKQGNTNASGPRSEEFRAKMSRIALERATRRGQKHGQQQTPAS